MFTIHTHRSLVLTKWDIAEKIKGSNDAQLKSAMLDAQLLLDNKERILAYLSTPERKGENDMKFAGELSKIDKMGSEARTELQKILKAHAGAVDTLATSTAQVTPAAIPPNAPTVTTSGATRPVDISQDMTKIDFLSVIENPLVSKEKLKLALTKAAKSAGGIDAVYERVVGEKGSDAIKFQDALVRKLTLIQNLVGGDRGLEAVLAGTVPTYLLEAERHKKLPRGSRANPETLLSPGAENISSLLATIGIGVVSGGVVTFTNETEKRNAEKFIQEYKDYENANTAEKWWIGLKETISGVFTGKKLALQFLKNESEGNVQKYLDDIWKYMDVVFNPKNAKNKEIATLATSYGYNPMSTTPERYMAFQKALIETYIQTEGFKRQGTDYSLSLGVFTGGRREEIMAGSVTPGKESSAYRKIGTEKTLQSLDVRARMGMSIDYDATEKKWMHTLPREMTVGGKKQPIMVTGQASPDGKYAFDMIMDMQVADEDGKYVITFIPRKDQPKPQTALADATTLQSSTARNIREKTEKSGLADKLRFIGHGDPKTFGPLLLALSRQDDAAIDTALTGLAKTQYKTLAKNLKADRENAATWTTYMYGSNASRNMGSIDEKTFVTERSLEVLKAESVIAKQLGINASLTGEETFAPLKRETSKQASTSAPGQEMSSIVFATPKGGLHRADTMDGSIATMSVQLKLSGDYSKQVIDAFEKSIANNHGIDKEVKNLNTFAKLSGDKVITKAEYITYLKTGDIAPLAQKVPGLALQDGKDTKVFESRAMIAGNACANRSYHIAYPAFSISTPSQVVNQSIVPAGSIDAYGPTAPVGQLGTVQTRETALGVNLIALGINQVTRDTVTKPSTSTPTNGNSTSTPTNGTTRVPGTAPAGNTGRVPTAPTVTMHPTVTQTVVTESATNNIFSIGTGVFGSLDQMVRMVPRTSQKTEKRDETSPDKKAE